MKWGKRTEEISPPAVLERIRPVEIPILTEVKRRLGRDDVAGALLYSYPKVVEDLARAYQVDIPIGYSHREVVSQCFTPPMAGSVDFFDRLYRLYAPVRYGGRAAPGSGEEVFEIVQSLYAPEPMWRLYLSEARPGSAPGTSSRLGSISLPSTSGQA